MDQSSKFLLIGGKESNLYVYNLEDNEFEEHPDKGDISIGIQQMDLDTGTSASWLAMVNFQGVLTVYQKDMVHGCSSFDDLQ